MVNKIADKHSTTEGKILDAAKKVFISRGFDGTSMQTIADEAGIHKSLLHYYFRTKSKLFEAVFNYALQRFVPKIREILISGAPIHVKIEKVVSRYMDMLMKNEIIPAFILHEINRDPDRIFQIIQDTGLDPEIFLHQFNEEILKGNIQSIDPRHLVVNLISLCVFPVAARPLIQRMLFANDTEKYQNFLHERENVVTRFLIQSIKK